MEKWRGKNAVVTGAGGGIGSAIVRDFANAGINVIGLDILVEKVETLEVELRNSPGKVIAMSCDISNKESVESAFEKIETIFGTIQILVNTAGSFKNIEILGGDDSEAMEKIEKTIQTNFTGLIHCVRKSFRLIEKSDDYGMIINMGSIGGHTVPVIDMNFNVYVGTKHAIRATTEVLRMELVRKGNRKIRVAEISPGAVDTRFTEYGGFVQPGAGLQELGFTPILKPEDVSQAVTFLLMTSYTVNVTEIIIKPTGEPY